MFSRQQLLRVVVRVAAEAAAGTLLAEQCAATLLTFVARRLLEAVQYCLQQLPLCFTAGRPGEAHTERRRQWALRGSMWPDDELRDRRVLLVRSAREQRAELSSEAHAQSPLTHALRGALCAGSLRLLQYGTHVPLADSRSPTSLRRIAAHRCSTALHVLVERTQIPWDNSRNKIRNT